MRRALALVAIAASISGCFTLVGPPPAGYESDELACADGRDNDQDGTIDCADSDCLRGGFCGVQIPIIPPRNQPENTYELCTDGIDNDDNGKFDCGDTNCQSILELCCSIEVDNASCSDLIDNDGNGFADCADYSCSNNRFVTVCQSETGRCTDRIDNDGDRYTDCNDRDCATDRGCVPMPPTPEDDCTDGVDENRDGRTDCSDVTCYGDPACLGDEHSLERCRDGNDNDANGYVDCADFNCSHADHGASPEAVAYCASMGEHTLEQCMNGEDDDHNRYTDCGDHGCTEAGEGATQEAIEYCAAHAENTLERCSDGMDNDGNGYVDCGDFSCSRSTDPMIMTYCSTLSERSFERCHDHIDNDGNGYVDCADNNCRFIHISWGFNTCDTNTQCPDFFTCRDGVCRFDCTDVPCPRGQCVSGECVEFCADDSECDRGETCYRGKCLELRSACFESMWIDDQQTIQGNEDGSLDQMSTCEERVRMARASCTDGVDSDADGFTDCEDWECNHNLLVVSGDAVQACMTCADGIDNDGDGLMDCQDWKCTQGGLAGTDPGRCELSGMPEGPLLCRFAGGRTCAIGPRAGMACASDDDCLMGMSGACSSRPGPAGQSFVCP